MIKFSKASVALAVASAAGAMLAAGPASTATVSLTGSTAASCTFSGFAGNGAGDFTFTCTSGTTPPPSATTPACSGTTLSATVTTATTVALSCTSATTGATWTQSSGPAQVGISGIASNVSFPTVGTYAYSVTPTGATSGTPVTVTINVIAATSGGTVNTTVCSAYPKGVKSRFDFAFGASVLDTIRDWYQLPADSTGQTAMTSARLYWPAPLAKTQMGSIKVGAAPALGTEASHKWVSISETPCDFSSAAKWVTKSFGPTITYTVEAQEGYITPLAYLPAYRTGIRLQAGRTYYLNIVNALATGTLSGSCPTNANCGVVVDIWQPQ